MKKLGLAFAALASALSQPVFAQQDEDGGTWTQLVEADLSAIYDILARNHPGPVDPANSFYADWHESGFQLAREKAKDVKSLNDYFRVLNFYTNGFRDGHIGVFARAKASYMFWPGISVSGDAATQMVTVVFSENPAVPVGSNLIACDGQSVKQMFAERIAPYSFNPDIPHHKWQLMSGLFVVPQGDPQYAYDSCTFQVDGNSVEVELPWSVLADSKAAELAELSSSQQVDLGIEQIKDIWWIGLPSFNYSGEGAEAIKALIDEISENQSSLRKSIVVFDVRGNGGGNSGWGNAIARALYGDEWVSRIVDGFDNTVDWRVSQDNLDHLRNIGERARSDGLESATRYWTSAADAMEAALARGDELVLVESRPDPVPSEEPVNPIAGQVFLLTDGGCASACLDFADIVIRMPGTTHIGLPTYGDAVYIDNTGKTLPSGLAGLSYSLKVYRNRVRGNNEFYTPEILWPAGPMTKKNLVPWISGLSSGQRESDM